LEKIMERETAECRKLLAAVGITTGTLWILAATAAPGTINMILGFSVVVGSAGLLALNYAQGDRSR
jgi:hypothetical protein